MPEPTHEHEYDSLPPAIVDALRDLDGPAVMPDAQRDADVFSGARRHLAGANRKRRNLRLFIGGSIGGGLAAAAMLGIAFILGDPTGKNEPQADYAMETAPMASGVSATDEAFSADHPVIGDLNANGELDILDAYLLARRLDSGRTPSPASDANADGQINQADVDWIAARAVTLNPGEQG